MASRQRSLLVPEALGKLQKFSSTIQRRGTLKPHEDKRVAEGFSVLLRRPEENKTYHEFLSRVKDLCGHRGDAMVALCIVGLGKHAIKILKDEVQLDLPLEIAREKEGLWNTALDRIGRKYSDAFSSVPVRTATDTSQPGNLGMSKSPSGASRPLQAVSLGCAKYRQVDNSGFNPRSFAVDTASHSLSGPHHGSVSLDLRARDLANFLQEYQEPNKRLQMKCPLSGDPLPSICICIDQSAELMARLEFSQPLATMFIQYVMQLQQS